MELLYDPVIQFLGINPGDVSIFVILAKTLYMSVYGGIIYNGQKVKTTQISINR